jgi:hypothetical protein
MRSSFDFSMSCILQEIKYISAPCALVIFQ